MTTDTTSEVATTAFNLLPFVGNIIGGILTAIGIHFTNKYLLNRPKKIVRIPLTDLISKSKIRRGVSLDNLSMTEPLNFVKAFAQSALDGELTVWGHQMSFGNVDTMASPETKLQGISTDYWKNHEIDWEKVADPSNDNSKICTKFSLASGPDKIYRDLHVDKKQGYSWVKRNQLKFRKIT